MLWICSTFSHLLGPPHGFDPGLHPVAKISLGLNPPEEMDVLFFYSYEITNHLKLWNGKNSMTNLVFRKYLFVFTFVFYP